MKSIILNAIGIIILTVGAGFTFYQVQAITVSTENLDENAGYAQAEHVNTTEQSVNTAQSKVIPPEERDPNRLWCREHGLYEDECVICHPEIASKNTNTAQSKVIPPEERDPNRLWCREHGLYEDECVICHPEIASKNTNTSQSKVIPPEERDPNRLWCREHGLYEDECVICHPEIASKNTNTAQSKVIPPEERDPNRLWCKEHSVYEDECFICHPELASQNQNNSSPEHKRHEHEGIQFSNATKNEVIPPEERDPNRLWCREHGLYEDECVICHPEIALQQSFQANNDASNRPSIDSLYCNEHQMPEIECGICQPQLAAKLSPGASMKLRLPSLQSSLKAGIKAGKPLMGNIQRSEPMICEIQFDQTKVGNISSLSDGVIQAIDVDYGDQVEKGQVMFEVSSTEIANAKSEYLKSLEQEKLKRMVFEREKELRDKNITALQDYQQAQAEYQVAQTNTMTARQQLVNYGLTDGDIRVVRDQRDTSTTIKVRAPFAGTIVEKYAVFGEAVSAGETVVELVDLSQMWLSLSIPETQISSIQLNDEIQATFETLPGKQFTGKLTWISPRINQNTRMLKARATLDNTAGLLREGMFGQAKKITHNNIEKLLIPKNSLQFVDGKPFVFIKNEDDLYELRHVEPGVRAGESIEIVQGLSPEENLVIAGSFALKSEFLKSRFGAGCAHD